MAVLRGGDLNGPAAHASGEAYPSTTPSELGLLRRARPRGSTVPRRPYGALGQRGPLGPAPLRFGPPAAHGERAGLRGRPLSVASCKQGSWKGATAARAHNHNAHTLDFGSSVFPRFWRGQGLAMTLARRRDRGSQGEGCGRGRPGCKQAGCDATCAAQRPCRPVGRVPWGEGAALPRGPAANGRRRSARAIVTRRAETGHGLRQGPAIIDGDGQAGQTRGLGRPSWLIWLV